jgi:subtilisin family serine protease
MTADKDFIQTLTQRDDISHLIPSETIKLDLPIVSDDQSAEASKLTYGLKTVRAGEVWEKFGIRGAGVKVGILDTGYAAHPDLDGRVIMARDFISDYPENSPNDGQGHGTHCLGTIGGTDKSGTHIGVAPEVEFIVGKIFNDSGSTTTDAIMEAMQWIADPDGNPDTNDAPTVVSNSWGGGAGSMEKEKPRWDIVTSWRELGIVPVFAAGNSGPGAATMSVPGGYPHSFAVGATDENDKIARFSSRGPISWEGVSYIKPDISAPK